MMHNNITETANLCPFDSGMKHVNFRRNLLDSFANDHHLARNRIVGFFVRKKLGFTHTLHIADSSGTL